MALAPLLGSGLQAAEPSAIAPIDVRMGRHAGFSRIAIEWAQPVAADVRILGDRVVIAPVAGTVDVARVQARLDGVLDRVVHEDGTLTLYLGAGVAAARLQGVRSTVVAVDFRAGARPAPTADRLAMIVPVRRAEALAAAASTPERGPIDAADTPAPTAASAMSLPPTPQEVEGVAGAVGADRPVPEPDVEPEVDAPSPAAVAAAPAEAVDRADKPRAHLETDAAPRPYRAAGSTAPMPSPTASGIDGADRHLAPSGSLPPLPPPTPATVPARAGEPQPERPRQAATVALSPQRQTDERGAPATAALGAVQMPVRQATEIADRPETAMPSLEAASARAADGTVVVETVDGALHFTFPEPVGAAAWRRGGHVWLVFDMAALELVYEGDASAALEPVTHDAATIWRLAVPATQPVGLAREDATWRLTAAAQGTPASGTVGEARAIELEDAWLGATLAIYPSERPGERVDSPRREGSLVWLPTLQGVVVHDLAADVMGVADAAASNDATGMQPALPRPEMGPVLGLAGPTLDAAAARERRRALEISLFADPVVERRLSVARFLMGQAAPFEATAVLAAGGDEADAEAKARLAALEGAAALLVGRLERARALLPEPRDSNDQEAFLWQAMLAAEAGDWERCGLAFARSGQVWRGYPMALRRQIAKRAAEAAIQLDAPHVALAVLHHVEPENDAFAHAERLRLLQARALAAAGDVPQAERKLLVLTRPPTSEDVRLEALLELVRLRLDAGEIDVEEARAELEPESLAWAGRDDARPYWSLVADVRRAAGDARGAFEALGLARPAGALEPTAEQTALLRAAVAGEPPFEDALDDAVHLVDRHAGLLAEGAERAAALSRLAARVAEDTDALHVADHLYVRALAEAVPYAMEVELRLALAALRLRRHVPGATLSVLEPLDAASDDRVRELRAAAEGMRSGAAPTATAAPLEATVPPAPEVRTTLEAVDRALDDTRALLDGGP